MTIQILTMQPETVTDTSSNGGRMINSPVNMQVGGAGNFPTLSAAEQASGVTKIRKLFFKLADAANPTALRATVFLKAPSLLSDSRNYLVHGTQRDTVASMGTRKYGCGLLATAVTAADTVLVVDFEAGSGAANVVQAGDKIAALNGAVEDINLTVASVVWTVDQASITLTTGVLTDLPIGAVIASCIVDTLNINPKFDNLVKSFVGSTFDEVTHPILVGNLATIEETITLTITSGTDFTGLSDKRGALPNGSTSSDYAPVNNDFALPYFTVPAAGWGGTHTAGESMQFQVHPAAVPVFAGQVNAPNALPATDAAYISVRVEA